MSAKKNHLKRNITVAGLAVLLAVPALGSNNISSHIHLPSITANADTFQQWIPVHYETLKRPVVAQAIKENGTPIENHSIGNVTFPAGDHVRVTEQGTEGVDMNISDATHKDGVNGIQYSMPLSDVSAFESQDPSQNKTNNSNQTTTANNNQQSSSNQNNSQSNSNQYNSSSLPQTGENNTETKAGIAGIALLASSFGLAKLSKAKRNKNIHDAIIGSTFKDIGSSLK